MADPNDTSAPRTRTAVAARPLPRRRFKTNLRILLYRPRTFLRVYRWPLAVLAVGAVLDAVTTYRVVSVYGPESELHPAARLVFDILGTSPYVVAFVKVVQCGFACFVTAFWRRWCGWLLVLAGALYALASLNNHFLWL